MRFRSSPEKHINTKVAALFIFLLILAVISFGVNYLGVVRFMYAGDDDDPLGKKLRVLNQLVFTMQETEGAARLYSLTGSEEHRRNYQMFNDSVISGITRLAGVFSDSLSRVDIDTIHSLFLQKKEQTNRLIEVSVIDRHRRRYGGILSILPDSINYQISQITYSSIRTDSLTEVQEPPGSSSFFGRIANFLTGREQELAPEKPTPGIEQRVDSSLIIRRRQDPALQQVKAQLTRLDEQDRRFAALLRKQEEELVQLGNQLMVKMRQVIKELEKEALQQSAALTLEMSAMREELLQRLIFLGISALIVVLAFIAWIGRDLRRSHRLKEQLVISKQNVERLAGVKERFLANMSHEIRMPLTSIIGFSELLAKEEEAARVIRNSALHLLTLINDVLDFSRMEAGKLTLNHECIHPPALVQEVANAFMAKAKEKQVSLTWEVDEKVVNFLGDKTRLRQVLFNLTGNAIKFTDRGRVWIEAAGVSQSLIFRVGDTGQGIPERDQPGIFEEFSQSNLPVADNKGGAGLGLAISKRLVEMMGGQIGFESREGEGSVFWFKIPHRTCANLPGKKEVPLISLKDTSILVVDDDPLVCRLMEGFLSSEAATLVTTLSPVEAVELLEKNTFDLVISDNRMPQMNGSQFIGAVREELKLNTPILVLSAEMGSETVESLQRWPNVFLMSKPFSRTDLMKKLSSVIAGKEGETISGNVSTKKSRLMDLSGVTAFTGQDEAFFQSVVETFLSETASNLEMLESMINGRVEGIPDQAHKMLTGFRQFGVAEGVRILKGIEALGMSRGNQQELKTALRRLKKLWREVEKELRKQMP